MNDIKQWIEMRAKDVVDRCIAKVNRGLPHLTERQETVIKIANKYTREELDRELEKAIDRGDEERMHLILDAIDNQNQFEQLLHSLDQDQIDRLRKFAEELIERRRSK